MATYVDLRSLWGHEALTQKTEVALTIVINEILTNADTAAPYSQEAGKHDLRVLWAQGVIVDVSVTSAVVLALVLAANSSLTTTQITGASDASVLSGVKAVVDALAKV